MTTISADSNLGDSNLEEYVHRVSSFPVYDVAEERRLFHRARGGDDAALEALVTSHLRYVVDLALERRGWGVSLVGLIRAGNRGLVKAARRFDPADERRFRQYALWWVRQEMLAVLEVA